MNYKDKLELVPLWHRLALSLEEATAYSGIGKNKLIELAAQPGCDIVILAGNKKLFKRERLDAYIDSAARL